MKLPDAMSFHGPLPLPGLVLHPFTALTIAVVHLYLGFGHLSKLAGGDIQWTHIWKGFGAIAGAYVVAALASHGLQGRLIAGSSGLRNQQVHQGNAVRGANSE